MRATAVTLRPVDLARLDAIEQWLADIGVATSRRNRSAAVRHAIEVAYLDVLEERRVKNERGRAVAPTR